MIGGFFTVKKTPSEARTDAQMIFADGRAKKAVNALYGPLWRSEEATNLFFAKQISRSLNQCFR